ncbi:Mrp protein [Vibrio parahaemolyticus AQ3810]|nr:Mrp protein [Vibrio parahaemolyticus AQ3810]
MHQFTSKQDFCHWFNQFQHPQLVENWADIHGVVTITAQGEVKITLPFASNEQQRITCNRYTKRLFPEWPISFVEYRYHFGQH